MKVLGIETSCDETGAAVVADGRRILSNVVASQARLHARYGGIVPELASRKQVEAIIPVVETALREAAASWRDIDALAVTAGPGLAGSLLVGVNVAKAMAFARSLPLVGVNHLEGHIYANWLLVGDGRQEAPQLPALCLIVSGGHTDLILMEDHGVYRRLGRTRDDAAGEAFDKAARILGLGFPGGPAIQRAARGIDRPPLRLPRAWLRSSYDFSFSGLKTAVLRLAQGEMGEVPPVPQVAAAFQEAVVDVLVTKTVLAARQLGVRQILLAGGVAANASLRQTLLARSPVPVGIPPPQFCTDNAAMIAACGYFRLLRGQSSALDLDVHAALRVEMAVPASG